MAKFDEQVMRAWEEWEALTGAEANDPDDFVVWAMENKKLLPRMKDIRRVLRQQVTTVLRQALRRDPEGFCYRAKQCVTIKDGEAEHRLWFDTDRSGTPNLRQKATRQRRDGIASDVYRAVCDVDHMNSAFPSDPRLSFPTDFTDDVTEKRAADLFEWAEQNGQRRAA
jgi:hypothetical protein